MKKYSEKDIRSDAKRYAKLYGVDERRLARVLRRAMKNWPTERMEPLSDQLKAQNAGFPYPLTRFWASPPIEIVVTVDRHFEIGQHFLTPTQLLEGLENYGVVRVGNINHIWRYFAGDQSPLFDLDELATLTEEVRNLLLGQRELAVKHGMPAIGRVGHGHLDSLLRSYYTRQPREVRLSRPILSKSSSRVDDPTLQELHKIPTIPFWRDNVRFVYDWHDASLNDPRFIEISGLQLQDMLDLESRRETLVELKIRMLESVVAALRSRDRLRLLQECEAILSETLTHEDVQVFLPVDSKFAHGIFPLTAVFDVMFHVKDYESSDTGVSDLIEVNGVPRPDIAYREFACSGGLSRVLDLVCFCDAELQSGVWSDTCGLLHDRLDTDMYRFSRLRVTSYSDLLEPETMRILEDAYEHHLQLLKQRHGEDQKFVTCVNRILRDQLKTSVKVMVTKRNETRLRSDLQKLGAKMECELEDPTHVGQGELSYERASSGGEIQCGLMVLNNGQTVLLKERRLDFTKEQAKVVVIYYENFLEGNEYLEEQIALEEAELSSSHFHNLFRSRREGFNALFERQRPKSTLWRIKLDV